MTLNTHASFPGPQSDRRLHPLDVLTLIWIGGGAGLAAFLLFIV